MSYSLVAGDLEPDMYLTASLDGAADPLDGDEVESIEMRWRRPDGTESTVELTPVSLVAGQVKRVWEAGDTDDVGVHRGRIVVTYDTGEVETYPNDGSWFVWWVYA